MFEYKKTALSLTVLCAVLTMSATVAFAVSEPVVSVGNKDNPYYSPLGVSFKTLIIKPSIENGIEFDDNIYRDHSNIKSDVIATVKPVIEMATEWSLHEIKAGASAELGKYKNHSTENYDDYAFFVSGKYDISYGTIATARAGYDVRHEDRGSLDDVNGDLPTAYSIKSAELGFTRDLSVLKLYLKSRWRGYDYDDTQAHGTVIDNSGRNRTQSVYEAKLGYGLSDQAMVYVLGQYDRKRYDSASEQARNSDGIGARVGFDADLTGKVHVDVYGGFVNTSYESDFDDINAIDFGGKFLWNFTGVSSLDLSLERSVQETTLTGASGIVETVASLGLEHSFRQNLIADLHFEMNDSAYQGGSSLSASRDNVTYTSSLGVDYLLSQNWKVRAAYNYLYRDFSSGGQSYDDNRFMLWLRYAY